jgi:putative acetyltransferase
MISTMPTPHIIAYTPHHAAAWRTLNEAWVTRYFKLEAKDNQILGDPQGQVLDKGGAIFIAMLDSVAVGCVSMIPMADSGYELAKMAVTETAQGHGIGRKLMQACIDFAGQQKAPRIYIETNAVLTPAVTLYESCGFVHLPPQPTPYERCNVWMELRF